MRKRRLGTIAVVTVIVLSVAALFAWIIWIGAGGH